MRGLDFSKQVSLRDVLGEYMTKLGEMNEKVVVVNADLMGTCRNRRFCEMFPERSYNVGIAEQNMVSFAAGLAHEGYIPYAFSMAPFVSMRACEQCRTDVAYANLPVRLMATYAGCSGGISGATHWSIEDCAIMCAIPGMTVIEVSDANLAKELLKASITYSEPIYFRSSVEPVPEIYDSQYSFEIGKACIPRDGDAGAIICSGIVVKYAIEAADRINEKFGRKIRVVDIHTIKPIDRDAVVSAAKTKNLIVAQDHNVVGGLGAMVAQVIVEEGLKVNLKNIGIPDCFETMAHAPYLYHKFGYDADGLEAEMTKLLGI